MEIGQGGPWLTLILRNKDAYLTENLQLERLGRSCRGDRNIFPSLVSTFNLVGLRNELSTPAGIGGRLEWQRPLITIDMNPDRLDTETLPITANSQLNLAQPVPLDASLIRRHTLGWYEEHWSVAEIIDRVYSNLIFRFSDVVLFYADSREESIEYGATILRWCKRSPRMMDGENRPGVIIVFTDVQDEWSEEFTERKTLILDIIRTLSPPVYTSFLPSVGRRTEGNKCKHKSNLDAVITTLSKRAQECRARAFTRFKVQDFALLFGSACESFAAVPSSSFDFVNCSRYSRPVPLTLEAHISYLLKLAFEKEELKTSSFAPSIIASALMLDAFPPGLHRKSPATRRSPHPSINYNLLMRTGLPAIDVFRILYCRKVISGYNNTFPEGIMGEDTGDQNALQNLLSTTERAFIGNCLQMSKRGMDAPALHRENLLRLAPRFKILECMRSCLSCLCSMAEHRLHEGHALCSRCILLLGESNLESPYQCTVTQCPLCGHRLHDERDIMVRPPTAGVRVLTLDGGGVRGILELELLQVLEERLQLPLSRVFDLIVGTSTGGLIALGLGVKRWSIRQCQNHFEHLVVKAFHHRYVAKLPLIGRLIEFAMSYISDSLYDTSYFEAALRKVFGEQELLFGNGTDDGLKTAAIATTVDSFPCVLSNYNGPLERAKNRGYLNLTGNIMVHEAARSTSAAPFYHKSARVSCAINAPSTTMGSLNLQDGGTCGMNNPVTIAMREAQFLNPGSDYQDLLISVGSYEVAGNSIFSKDDSPPGWIRRISTAFLRSFDCQRAWNENISHLQDSRPDQYHRLAVGFRQELPFDDINMVNDLKYAARRGFEGSEQLSAISHAVEAKCFYFELLSIPSHELGFSCLGNIYCRLRAGSPELHTLITRLAEARAHFSMGDRVIASVDNEAAERVAMGLPLLLECTLRVDSLEIPICIMLKGPERHSVCISSFPQTLSWFVKTQGLDTKPSQECKKTLKHGATDYYRNNSRKKPRLEK